MRKVLCRDLSRIAINKKYISIPNKCEVCGSVKNVQVHHHDYKNPLLISTLCLKCHRKIHYNKEFQNVNAEKVFIAATDRIMGSSSENVRKFTAEYKQDVNTLDKGEDEKNYSSVRITDTAYLMLKELSKKNKTSMAKMIDIIIDEIIKQGVQNETRKTEKSNS